MKERQHPGPEIAGETPATPSNEAVDALRSARAELSSLSEASERITRQFLSSTTTSRAFLEQTRQRGGQ